MTYPRNRPKEHYWDGNISWTLSLHILAISIQKGDIICLLRGASDATIIGAI